MPGHRLATALAALALSACSTTLPSRTPLSVSASHPMARVRPSSSRAAEVEPERPHVEPDAPPPEPDDDDDDTDETRASGVE